MYKPPLPEDDEPQDIPEFSYPSRQRRGSRAGTTYRRRVPGAYRTDERPGEPKIKRASLLREQQAKQAETEAAREETGKAKAIKKPVAGTSRLREETRQDRAIKEVGAASRGPRQQTSHNRIVREPDTLPRRGGRD